MPTLFIGRDRELGEIRACIDGLVSIGGILFITGEAGMGKTQLLNKALDDAAQLDIRILRAEAKQRGRPYGLFSDVFAEHLEGQLFSPREFVSFDELFLISPGGLLVAHCSNKENVSIDEDIMSGMLTAVQNFVKDSFGDEGEGGGLGKLEYKNTKILIEHGSMVSGACVLTGGEHPEMRANIKQLVGSLEREHGDTLKDWGGDTSGLGGINKELQAFISKRYSVKTVLDKNSLESRRIEISEQVYNLGLKISRERPLLIVIEDLHWADESSVSLLKDFSRIIKDHPILLIGTWRPEETNDVLDECVSFMENELKAGNISLESFGLDGIRELTVKMLNIEDPPPELIERIKSKTEGNPFYIEQLLRIIIEESGIVREKGLIRIKPVVFERFEESLSDIVMRRLDVLSREALELAEFSAVLGTGITHEAIAKAIGRENAIKDGLAVLFGCNILMESNGNYEFSHALIRDAVYSGISQRWKKKNHALAGDVLEDIYANNLDEVVFSLANHYHMGNVPDKAIKYGVMAGDRAAINYAIRETYEYYGIALKYLEDAEKDEDVKIKTEVLISLGEFDYIAGKWDEGIERLELAAAFAEKIEEPGLLSRACSELGRIKVGKSDWKEGGKCFDKAQEISEKIDDLATLARTYESRGWMYWMMGEYDKSIAEYLSAMSRYTGLGDKKSMARCQQGLGIGYEHKGEYDQAIDYYNSARSTFEDINDNYNRARIYNSLGVVYQKKRDYKVAIDSYEKFIEIVTQMKFDRFIAYGMRNAGEVYALMDELDRALEYCEQALGYFKKLDEKYMVCTTLHVFGTIYRKMGDVTQALEYYREGLEMASKLGMPDVLAQNYRFIGESLIQDDEFESAKENIRKALDIWKELGNKKRVSEMEAMLASIE